MVNYSYSDYFYKNKKKDILVVDVGATVTAVSGEAPTVSGATVEIHTEDLQIETFELEENLCSEDNLKFGLCEAARISFTIENKATIPGLATNDFDQMLNVYIYFDGDSDTLFQVGQYVCKSDEYSADRQLRKIELYDMLYYLYDLDITAWYNKAYSDNGGLPITVYNLRTSLFTWLINEADYPITQETTTLVNDGMSVAKTIDSDYISFGDFMQGLLEANGVFGHIGRTGLFEYKGLVWYDQPSVATITDDFRKPPTQYKDYTTWGVGFVQVYQDDELIMSVGSTNRRHPSNYSIVDNFVFKDIKKQNQGGAILNLALTNLREKITHLRYKPCEVECAGNLCLEVGDKIDVTYDKDGDGVTDTFYTFILERRLKGLNMMLDTYSARGDKKQPKPDIRTNYGGSDTTESEGTATSGEGTSGVTLYDSENDRLLMEKMRNVGFRFLAEPVANVVYDRANNEVEITWSDPSDISTQQPHECEWAGTCVIRKENSAPLHRWDGTLIVKSTTRDQYSENAYIDNTIEPNKRYYYAIMPYYIAIDDSSNSIAHYTWTKVFSVNTANFIYAPTITGLQVYDVNVIATFEIPTLESGSYSYIKIVAKKGSIPTSKTDGIVKDLQASDTGVQFTGLDAESRYYFVIFASDGVTEVASDPDDCLTGLSSYAFYEKAYGQALSDYSFDDIVKRNDWNSRYLQATPNIGYWTIFDNRFTYPGYTNQELLYMDYSLKTDTGVIPSKSGNIISINNTTSGKRSGGFGICTKDIWISQVEFDLKIVGVSIPSSNEAFLKPEFYAFGSSSYTTGIYHYVDGTLKFTGDNTAYKWSGTTTGDIVISDNNWHHVKIILSRMIKLRFISLFNIGLNVQVRDFTVRGYIE